MHLQLPAIVVPDLGNPLTPVALFSAQDAQCLDVVLQPAGIIVSIDLDTLQSLPSACAVGLATPADIRSLTNDGDVVEAPKSIGFPARLQMRWKFFSTSRRVSRSITGRPCGQMVEYAVLRSSSRMCAIFSAVSG